MPGPDDLGERLPALGARGGGWVIGQMVLIFLVGVVSYPSFDALPPSSAFGWVSFAAGVVLVVIGAWLAYRGIDALGPNLTAFPAPSSSSELVVTGPYERIRHPIYAGVILLTVGWAFLVVSPAALVVAALLAVWLDLKSRREEAWLYRRFPGYEAYRARTWRFIPGVY
jgi:protein-S-isoprenylcysteine O-methyltransferase Ste14